MKIGVLETGMVGNAIASKPVALGRDVMMGVPQDTWFEGTTYEWTRYYEPNIVAGVRVTQIR